MASNLRNRRSNMKSDHCFLVVPGGPGIGKTRFAHELQFRFPATIVDDTSKSTFSKPLYLYIDLNNGLQYDYLFDSKYDASTRLGVRLASHYFASETRFLTFVKRSADSIELLDFPNILRAIVQHERRSRHPDEMIPIILHIDEYQLYIDSVHNEGGLTKELSRRYFKDMLRQIGIFMISSHHHALNICLLPVCTGTSPFDITFLPTEYHGAMIQLPPLSREHAEHIARDSLGSDWEKYKHDTSFQIALHDTGFIPRFVEFLLEVTPSPSFEWGVSLYGAVKERYHTVFKYHLEELVPILRFGISQIKVDNVVKLNGMTLGEAEREGLVFLEPVFDGGVVVLIPFVLMRVMNDVLMRRDKGVFPSNLLFSPTSTQAWRWQDFELLIPYFHHLLAVSVLFVRHALSSSTPLRLRDLLRGCSHNDNSLIDRTIELSHSLQVFEENQQCLTKIESHAEFKEKIACGDDSPSIYDGVFICREGNALVDFRTAVRTPKESERKPILLLFQVKHSALSSTSNSITSTFIEDWCRDTLAAFSAYQSTFDIALVFVTNRRLVGDLPNSTNLFLISEKEIPAYLGPLASRGLLAV
eukprot:TRINITY_DN722_c0_g1_i2.p1 TRINITY_DN722_c0_g1~~TRINITY_DN722_c0_g1_i2.p1  ORF type:complete len:586 (+),score=123.54 TRINITY_DN722_c0_g1_i2:414-2171(+)